MKNILRLVILAVFATFASVFNTNAQSLELVHADTLVTYDAGTTESVVAYAQIKNISSESKSVKVTLNTADMSPKHNIGYCWGSCFSPSANTVTSDPLTIAAGASSGAEDFDIQLANADWMTNFEIPGGKSTIHVTFFVADNPDDKITFDVVFTSTTDVVDENSAVVIAPAVPNPANETIALSYELPDGAASAELKIFDMNGNTLETATVNAGSDKYIYNCSALANGTYFYALTVNGKQTKSSSFVIAR